MISFDKYSKAHNSEIISRGFLMLMVIIYLMLDFKILPYYSQFVKVSSNVNFSTKIPPFQALVEILGHGFLRETNRLSQLHSRHMELIK